MVPTMVPMGGMPVLADQNMMPFFTEPFKPPLDVQPSMMPPETYVPQDSFIQIVIPPAEPKEKKLNIMKLYTLTKRSVAFQLDPELCRYQGQITFELEFSDSLLKLKVLDKLEKYQQQGFSKIHLEAKFLLKQAQIVDFFSLEESETGIKKKSFNLKDMGLTRPED